MHHGGDLELGRAAVIARPPVTDVRISSDSFTCDWAAGSSDLAAGRHGGRQYGGVVA